jgi:hypothetical protein
MTVSRNRYRAVHAGALSFSNKNAVQVARLTFLLASADFSLPLPAQAHEIAVWMRKVVTKDSC